MGTVKRSLYRYRFRHLHIYIDGQNGSLTHSVYQMVRLH